MKMPIELQRKIKKPLTIVLVVVVIGIIMLLLSKTKQEVKKYDSELERTMSYEQFEDGDENIDGTEFVTFSSFFLRDLDGDNYAEKIKGTCKKIGAEDTLYMELNVLTNGYLKDGKITINSDNFYLQTAIPKDTEIKENAIGNNIKEIYLNDIKNGTQKLLTGIVRSGDYTYTSQKMAALENNVNKYSRINTITLTGIHVSDDGVETPISKTIELNMDWYGNANTEIPVMINDNDNINQSQEIDGIIDEEKEEVNLEFTIGIQETANELILKNAYIEGEIPELNGYKPKKVEVVGTNTEYTYDETTMIFTAIRETTLDENGKVQAICYDGSKNVNRYNEFNLKITYPLEAYQSLGIDTISLKIPVKAYYEGYNNSNDEFSNPFKSNIASDTFVITFEKPEGSVAIFDVVVGKKVYSPVKRYIVSKNNPLKIYNGFVESTNLDTYVVTWIGSTGITETNSGMLMKETTTDEAQVSDQFIKSDSSEESMENLTTNIGIYFEDPTGILGEDGWIKIYNDQTNELICEFTKENWNNYDNTNYYKYDTPVKHIRVETSKANILNSLYVYNIKELDDEYITNNYTKEEFDNLKYIKSTVTGYMGDNYINTDISQANYETPYSIASVNINKDGLSTQQTEKNVEIKINTICNENANQEKWKNGAFLLKIPEGIIDVEINSVESNSSNIEIISYEQYEENGNNFIKILTSNENESTYTLTINCNLTPDPRIQTRTETIELYASNESASDYYYKGEDVYDVNNNLNVIEYVNKNSITINLVSPNSLLTNQIASSFDDTDNIVIAPKVATVNKDRRTARVNIEISNNYSGAISEVAILGRVPYEGNKYAINGNQLGSTFTATMSESGIELPEELSQIAKIYYSENGEATRDIQNSDNGWTETPEDFSKVKSYLIDLSNYELQRGEKHTVSYEINIPEGLSYNEVSYSHHAVYFCLNTPEGKLKTQTEPNKVGFMIAKQFDLELVKYQKNKDKVIEGATYSIQELGQEAKTRVTGIDGILKLTGLYAEREYIVKEIKSPNEYELNEEIVRFTTTEENSILDVEKLEGTVKNISAIQPQDGEDYKVHLEVEDEAKAKLKIIKTEQETGNLLNGVKYKIKGDGIVSSGRILTTNAEGIVSISGLKVGKEYTLEETKATGYYLSEPIKFVVKNNEGTYEIELLEGTVKNASMIEEDYFPTAVLEIENEKIPTCNLEINKVVKNEDTPLGNVKFELIDVDTGTSKFYTTSDEGKILIDDIKLYEGRNISAEYILKEVETPEGYITCGDISFKISNENGNLELQILSGEVKNYSINGNIASITIENASVFKLIKKDIDTGESIPNTQFIIYDDEDNLARDVNGNYLGKEELYSELPLENDETYPWNKNSDNTWISGNYNINNSTSTLTINDFELQEQGTLSFDWSVSSESPNYDYLYYEITNPVDGSQIAYEKIEGLDYGSTYDELEFEHKEITLEPGIYKVKFVYRKDKYTHEGLDKGYIKNINIDKNLYKVTYMLETDENGEITANLPSGIYKAVEVKSNEAYQFTNDNTYYFGIDEEVEPVYGIKSVVKQYEGTKTASYAYVKGIAKTSDGGYVVCGDFMNDLKVNDEVIYYSEGDLDGFIIKYNEFDEVEWSKHILGNKEENINKVIVTSDDGIIICGGSESKKLNLSNEKVIQLDGADSSGIIIKYNNNGDLLWENTYKKTQIWSSGGATMSGGVSYMDFRDICETSDGNYVAVGNYGDSLHGYKITFSDGTEISTNGESDGFVIKYDSMGNILFAYTIGSSESDSVNNVIPTNDGGYIISIASYKGYYIDIYNNGVTGSTTSNTYLTVKYNSNGNWLKYDKKATNETITDLFATNDGGYIVSGIKDESGYIKKYNSNNIEEWITIIEENINIYTALATFEGFDGTFLVKAGSNLYKISSNGEILESNINTGLWDNLDGTLISENRIICVGYTYNSSTKGAIAELKNDIVQDKIYDISELIVYNKKREYYINTAVQYVNGVKGGTISGESENPYETVKYGETNTKEIEIIPDENFEILNVKVNGQEIEYTKTEDGKYFVEPFENIKQSKYVVVTFISNENKLEITKIDEDTSEPLENVKFKVSEVQPTTDSNRNNLLTELVENGEPTDEEVKEDGYQEDLMDNLVNNGDYYFINQDGVCIPTNSKKYQAINGGNEGIQSSAAKSYIEIDLTEKEGYYSVFIDLDCSTETTYDYGYMTIRSSLDSTKNIDLIASNISGEKTSQKYTSDPLIGGNKYYLLIEYHKDSNGDVGEDCLSINSINLQEMNAVSYYFTESDGVYTPNNQGIRYEYAASYIPIDLRDYKGTFKLTVNAEMTKTSNSSYGGVGITTTSDALTYYSSTNRFVYLTSTTEATDYTKTLQGGTLYYLHMGYYTSSKVETDYFKINSINLEQTSYGLSSSIVTTDENGKAMLQLTPGKYNISEYKQLDNYIKSEDVVEVQIDSGEEKQVVITNKKMPEIIVHHYIKDTTTEVYETEKIVGTQGDSYITEPKLDLEKYKLETDENGKYIIPENATGVFGESDQEVIYYYVEKEIPLIVNHYIESTTENVPLQNGETAQSEKYSRNEGEEYVTSSIGDDVLDYKYELVKVPNNSVGTYSDDEIIVTYYYKKVKRNIVLQKYAEDGITPLPGAKFKIEENEYITDENGQINLLLESGVYEIEEIEAPEGYVLPENPIYEITVTRDTAEGEIFDIVNQEIKGTITIHHYIEGTTEKIKLSDGTIAEDEIKTGNVDDIYVTKPREDASIRYEVINMPDNSSGRYINGNIEITYYYKEKESSVLVHHYKEGTTEKLSEDELINGYVEDEYVTYSATDIPEYYELVEEPLNKNGKMGEEQIVVVYYYQLKKYEYEVNYLEKDTNTPICESKKSEAFFGKTISAFDEIINIEGYEFDCVEQEEITIEKENNIINIYYTKCDSKVVVKYLEKNSNIELSEEDIIFGNINELYTTEAKEIDNYTMVEYTDNISGKFSSNPIEVIYYYLKNTKVTVNYIDKISGEYMGVLEHEGVVTEKFTSISNNYVGYLLVEKPENETVIMDENEIILNYYYEPVSSGVIEKHINIYTNEIIENKLHEGEEGEYYTTSLKEFEEYEIITNQYYYEKYLEENPEYLEENNVTSIEELLVKLNLNPEENYIPNNQEGTITTDVIEVTYYYRYYSSVIVEYIDKLTGEKLLEKDQDDSTETIKGYEGDLYKTEEKIFEDYELISEPKNKEGTMTKDVIYVKYYYEKNIGKITEKHIDIYTGEILGEDEYIKIKDSSYSISSREFDGYKLINNKQYYEKYIEENPEYLEENNVSTIDELLNELNIDPEKDYIPANFEGTVTIEPIEVIYYYGYPSKVIVEYIDKETNKEIDSAEIINGYEGNEYITEEKEFKNYILIEEPDNKSGIITKDTIYVRYYYEDVSASVVEQHIDVMTGEVLETNKYEGCIGDTYSTSEKNFEGYELVKDKYPENKDGKMEKREIIVKYYYIRKITVRVEYLEINTNKVLAKTEIIEGHEGDKYKTEIKNINGFNIITEKIPKNKEGTLGKEDIIIRYYYESDTEEILPIVNSNSNINNSSQTQNQVQSQVKSQEQTNTKTPDTGDLDAVRALVIMISVILINAIQLIISKHKKY